LVTPQATFNETVYAENGPIVVGAQYLWGVFFDYAAYTSALTWIALFGFSQIKGTVMKLRANQKKKNETMNNQYDDQLNILQRSYKEVPLWWYLALFLSTFVVLITIFAKGLLFIPIWTYFIALATGAVVVIVSNPSISYKQILILTKATWLALCHF
jgi:hypothetical protein